jgi:hypothetical protein
MDRELKKTLADAIEAHLKEDAARSELRCEVHRVSNLVVQFKVWEEKGPPRYLNVKITEMM